MNGLQKQDGEYIVHTYGRFPVEIVSGEGSVVKDPKGKEYIDFTSGIGVTSFGLCDGLWVEAVEKQLHLLQHMSNLYYTEPCVRLARLLVEKTGMKRVFFGNSGAEANECVIKAARKYAAEKKGKDCYTIITMENSFHGRTITTLAATGQEHYHELFRPLTPGFVSVAPDDFSALEQLSEKTNPAAVMLECIQGEGGVRDLSEDYLRKVADYCKAKDILLIVDEVQTGNGRTGKMYSYMHSGIAPDLVSTAKGLGGGLPIGAALFGEKVMDVFGPGDHGSTFGGNPIACAGACSIVERLDDALFREVERKGAIVRSELKDAKGVRSVTGKGLMIGIETERPAGEIVKEAIGLGVLCLTAKEKVRLLPALNIPEDVLRSGIGILKEVIAK